MRNDTMWQREDLSKRFLEGVRAAIPLADYQIKVMLYLIRQAQPKLKNFLDIGCGDGVLGRAILDQHPQAQGVFLDFSETMIEAARQKASKNSKKLFFFAKDYSHPQWVDYVKPFHKFDVIVSGLSIHHQPDKRKKEIYKEIFKLLAPGGLFLNLEHISSPSPWVHHMHDEFFIDSLHQCHSKAGAAKTRQKIAQVYYNNPCRKANILAPLDDQCAWLRKIGFKNVDCYLKIFELALFGGIKPH